MIRPLELHEIARIAVVGEEFVAEASYPDPFSLDHFCKVWAPLISTGAGEILIAETGDGELSGAIGYAFVADGFSGRPVVMENFWYVRKEFRSTQAGLNLFFGFENAGRVRDVKKYVIVHLANLGADKLQAFYEKRGYKLTEQTFVKVVKD